MTTDVCERRRIVNVVGPAGLIASKEINDLHLSETVEIPDVPLCLSHCIVSPEANKNPDFERLEHAVYHGRQRFGRYTRIAAQRYAPPQWPPTYCERLLFRWRAAQPMIVSLGYFRPASPKAMLAIFSRLQHGRSLRGRHRCMPSVYPPNERGAV